VVTGGRVRIGLASDSHGNLEPLERAIALFERAQVDRIFFLGGRVADVDAVLARRAGSRDEPVPGSDAEFLSAVRSALARQAAAGTDALAGRIVRVASRACPEYETRKVPAKQMDMVDGRICCLVHDKAELSREDISNASVLFHGNSSAAALVQIGPRCFVTPGHLRRAAPGGQPPTFAIAEVDAREIVLTVFSDECAELRQERVAFATAGKMSVR
jgi:predicted phosphodiesterase